MHHLLSHFFFFTFNQSVRHLGCYQANGVSIDKIHLSNAEETEVASEWHLDDFTQFNAAQRDMQCFYLQLQMHK